MKTWKPCKNYKLYKGLYKPRCSCCPCWMKYIKALKRKVKELEARLMWSI